MSAAARMQGRRVTITESSFLPSRSTSSLSKPAGSATGSMTSTFFTPSARATPLDRDLAGGLVVEPAAGAGVLLLAGHGGGAVVEHQQHVAVGRRVVDHLHQAVDAGVDEGGVADERDHAPGLGGGEHVAQPEADAERGAHGHAACPWPGRAAARRACSSRCRRPRCSRACAAPSRPGGTGRPRRAAGACRAAGPARARCRGRAGAAPAPPRAPRTGRAPACPRPGCRRRGRRRR